jgi:uncharacterized membrane protein
MKGAHAVIECAGGIALALVSTSTIADRVNALPQDELIEDPKDLVATHMLAMAQNLSIETKHFYAFYLLSHGIVKLLLVIGLLKGTLWSYPVSLIVLGLFIVYRLYRFTYTHGAGLIVLTAFDDPGYGPDLARIRDSRGAICRQNRADLTGQPRAIVPRTGNSPAPVRMVNAAPAMNDNIQFSTVPRGATVRVCHCCRSGAS